MVALASATFGDRGPPVVLLHGQGGHGGSWDLQIEALRADHRVFAVDLRGHGASPRVPGPYSMSMLAADVAESLAALAPFHVVGHSLGAMVALSLAIEHPSKLASAVAINGAAFSAPSRLRSFVIRAVIRALGMRTFARANAGLHFPPEQAELRARFIDTMGACSADTYLSAQAAVDGMDLRARLGELSRPLLVIHSEHDLIPLADKQLVVDRAPGARLAILHGSRHIALWDAAPALNTLLRDWLHEVAE